MSQRLASSAVSGGISNTTSSYSISDEALAALRAGDVAALMASHTRNPSGLFMELNDEDEEDEDEDVDGGADDDEDESDEDEDDEDKGDKSKSKKTDPRIKELSDENAKWRVKYRNRGKRIADLEAENAELKKGKAPKSKSKEEDEDDDKSTEDSDELKQSKEENAKLKAQLAQQTLRQEFNDLTSGEKPLAKFKNPKTAFRLLDLDDVEIDEDGDITGLDDAIKALAKSDPYLLDTGKKDDDEDEDEDQSTGQRAGRKRGKGNPNRDKLLDKYPALRR